MHAVSLGGERHVDAVVDDEGYGERGQCLFDGARPFDHRARFAQLVAQLHQRRPALRAKPRQIGEIAAAGALGIDDGIEAKIDRCMHFWGLSHGSAKILRPYSARHCWLLAMLGPGMTTMIYSFP